MDNMNYDKDNMKFTNETQPGENNMYITEYNLEAEKMAPDQYEGEWRNGHINIQSVPVKKHRFRKAIPIIASTLVSAVLGGVIGGVYVNYLTEQKNYEAPVTINQNKTGSANQISYTPPSGLIAKVASEVGPAIVGVDIKVVAESFFGQKQVGQGSGSGIIFDKRGYIVTNQHVIDGAGANGITVTLAGGKKYPAQIIGQDNISDIAILKINANNLPVAAFGDSSKVRVGDLAIAIGNPMGEEFAGTVTSGIISALNRTVYVNEGDYSRRYKLIQTDAAINPGNSGGALINADGEVIGINTIKFVDTKVEGMNFAIPINEAKEIIDQLLNNGYVSRPYLGVEVVTVTEEDAKQLNMVAGIGVQKVFKGSAAETAGLKPRDIILEVQGVKVSTNDDFINELYKYKVGESITLKVWREGNTIDIPITLGEKKDQSN